MSSLHVKTWSVEVEVEENFNLKIDCQLTVSFVVLADRHSEVAGCSHSSSLGWLLDGAGEVEMGNNNGRTF